MPKKDVKGLLLESALDEIEVLSEVVVNFKREFQVSQQTLAEREEVILALSEENKRLRKDLSALLQFKEEIAYFKRKTSELESLLAENERVNQDMRQRRDTLESENSGHDLQRDNSRSQGNPKQVMVTLQELRQWDKKTKDLAKQLKGVLREKKEVEERAQSLAEEFKEKTHSNCNFGAAEVQTDQKGPIEEREEELRAIIRQLEVDNTRLNQQQGCFIEKEQASETKLSEYKETIRSLEERQELLIQDNESLKGYIVQLTEQYRERKERKEG